MGGRILLVEDRLQSRKNIAYFLRTEGYEVNEASSGKEAMAAIPPVAGFLYRLSFTAFAPSLRALRVDPDGRFFPGHCFDLAGPSDFSGASFLTSEALSILQA